MTHISPKGARVERELSPEGRTLKDLLTPLDELAATSSSLVAGDIGQFTRGERLYKVPRYVFVGPKGGDTPIPIGIFAGIYGDEIEGIGALVKLGQILEANPDIATGYCLFLYPICNPTGVEANTSFSSNGKDLNLEILRFSSEPEAQMLQAELAAKQFQGVIKLHVNREETRFQGLARGETLTRYFLEPALLTATDLLGAANAQRLGGFQARDVSCDHYEGSAVNAPKIPSTPFEIILETPGHAAPDLREAALVAALRSILGEYQKFIAYAPNL